MSSLARVLSSSTIPKAANDNYRLRLVRHNERASDALPTIVNANSQTVLTLTYDSADRVQTRTDSQGYVLTYAYDNLDRVTSITYPDGTTDLYD